jgi:hypothetical protein
VHSTPRTGSPIGTPAEQPRTAAEIPEWELEEVIRDVIEQTMRRDIADRALAWLDQRIDAATWHAAMNGSRRLTLSAGLPLRLVPHCPSSAPIEFERNWNAIHNRLNLLRRGAPAFEMLYDQLSALVSEFSAANWC